MKYRMIKEDVSEIASQEEIEKIEKAQEKSSRDVWGENLSLSELFDMVMYYKLLGQKAQEELYQIRTIFEFQKLTNEHPDFLPVLEEKKELLGFSGRDVNGYDIAQKRQEFARFSTASSYWGGILEDRLKKEGKTLNVNLTVKEFLKLIVAESKFENKTRSKKIGPIKENKQKILDKINQVFGEKEPGEE